MKRSFLLSTSFGVVVLIAAAAGAQKTRGPAAYEITWQSIDGGGGTATGDDYVLAGSIGQPDAGAMSGGGFDLTGGFWTAEVEPVNTCPADIVPRGGDGQVTIADITFVLSAFGLPCNDCPQDVVPPGGDNQVTIADITFVLAAFGQCPP
jgi:hypothetical protein